MEKAILFGASTLGEFAFNNLSQKYSIEYFCDNDKHKIGKTIQGITIINPDTLINYTNHLVIITSSYVTEIVMQLEKMGINNFMIFNIRYELGTNITTQNSYIPLYSLTEKVEKGKKIIDILEEEKGVVGRSLNIFNSIKKHINMEALRDICEIGPGNGWFLDRFSEYFDFRNVNYYIYEPSIDWEIWLKKNYNVISRKVSGNKLGDEKGCSCDFVHAHAVLVYLNHIDIFSYLKEMIRVTKNGGYICFNILPLEEHYIKDIELWQEKGMNFPIFYSNKLVTELFLGKCKLLTTFTTAYGPTFSRYYLFEKL
ncbi:MAG TPA: class I SAM-dependent methyltransferase [Bacillus bacterium]|nr:class I SAM-dependent methyltransferase [Bacillus sp. (in: firmicutes)]